MQLMITRESGGSAGWVGEFLGWLGIQSLGGPDGLDHRGDGVDRPRREPTEPGGDTFDVGRLDGPQHGQLAGDRPTPGVIEEVRRADVEERRERLEMLDRRVVAIALAEQP